jgi:hypothetical protein
LNNNLKAEYAALYENIMAQYEAKLRSGNIFDHNFPEVKFTCRKIDTSQLQNNPLYSGNDKELMKALLVEYCTYLDYTKTQFKEYETIVKRWFDSLPEEDWK